MKKTMLDNAAPAHPTRRQFVGAAAAAIASLALAGCGASGDGGSTSNDAAQDADSDAADAPTGAESRELTPITFCLDYTPNTNHLGIYVANALGYFWQEGLEVTIVQPAEDTAEALLGTGMAQLGVSYQDYIANAYAGGNTGLTAVAAIVQHNTTGIMSRAEDGIVSARYMEDHTYATWEMPVEQATIKTVVEADGGDYSRVQLVPYTVEDDVAGLKAGMFDCVWVYEGWAVQNAALQGVDVNYFSFISMDDVFDFYTPVIAANTAYAEENPEVVRAFLRAVRRGYEYAVANPAEAARILCDEVPELDPDLVAKSAEFLAGEFVSDAESWGVIDGERWARFYGWLNDNSLVDEPLDVDAGWTGEYLA